MEEVLVSDMSIDLAGVIALLMFMFSGVAFGFAAGISLIVSVATGPGTGKKLVPTRAFGFFIAAIPLGLINLAGFLFMLYTADSNTHRLNDLLDDAACGWLLLQIAIWIIAAIVFNKVRLR